jgi:hypothetical protein
VGIYGGSVSEVEEGEGVTKTGTYVSFECVLKIVDRSAAFPSCGTCSPKPLVREKNTIHELGNLSCSPPGKNPAAHCDGENRS